MSKTEKVLKPNEAGLVGNWLIGGAKEELYHTEHFNPNQLAFEKEIREIIADDTMTEAPQEIRLGAPALEAADGGQEAASFTWEYYPAFNNWFVDKSKFYFLLTKVEMLAATGLFTETARTVKARLWTFAAVTVWVNGKKTASLKTPVYKPIQYLDFDLELNQGEASAIALSLDIDNSMLIIDELKGRKIAEKLGLRYSGTFGLILKAKQLGVINSVKPILNKIRSTNFRFNEQLFETVLEQAGE